jgi:8-oxo-dGTP pyrophosphatase MutT (NUDIX family)
MFTLFTKRRHSYGVIPLRVKGDGVECLLIDQKDVHKPGAEYWTFPKGTPEQGETGIETALRETKEETGVGCSHIDPEFVYDDHYVFTVGLTQIEKTVTYYIGVADTSEVHVQEAEVRSSLWLPLVAAQAKLTNDHARKIIDAIVARLPHARLFEEN